MEKLTVIIPFLNEGEEVYNTVKNLRDTAGDKIDIMLINDASEDNYDYASVSKQFNTAYIHHQVRMGVAASRDEAIDNCSTEFFLLLDGHMRFFQTGWVELIISELEKDRRALFCCQSLALKKDENGNTLIEDNRATTFGAYIDFSEGGDMQAKWSTFDPSPGVDVVDIPCLLGAGYACNKTYWKYLGGLEGLLSYGMDEQLISMKVWQEGGKCKLLKHVKAGHFYRTSFPYKNPDIHLMYNRLFVAELLLPYKEKYNVFKMWDTQYKSLVKECISKLIEDRIIIKNKKHFYESIFNVPIDIFILYNNEIQNKS